MKSLPRCRTARNVLLVCGLLCAVSRGARGADITVEKEGAGKTRVSLNGLRATGAEARRFVETLQRNLDRSGWFVVASGRSYTGVALEGTCADDGAGGIQTDLTIRWPAGSFPWRRNANHGEVRRLAHALNDEMVRRILGRQGMASWPIAMVRRDGNAADLYVGDPDGGGIVRLTQDQVVCLAPRWSPRAESIFYTTYLHGYPAVYQIDLRANRRSRIAAYPGLNTGAAISPDGRYAAIVLSRTGNPELYVMTLATRRLTRLTYTTHAVEASPSWSPDGREIVYVSDTTGRPQLYTIGRDRREPRRLMLPNRENVSPDWGPDGRIAYTTRDGNRYQVAIYDPRSGQSTPLTQGSIEHEEPSWAPDARHLVCVRVENFRSSLVVLDTMGDPPLLLHSLPGEWISPAWSRP